jgi:translation initiation factor 1 (eIF-1/SUI1)
MVELEKLLVDYLPGRPEMKPDVIAQTLQLERDREKMAQEYERQNSSGGQIILQQDGQPPMALTNQQVVEIMQKQQRDIQNRDVQIVRLQEEMKQLRKQLSAGTAVTGSAVTGSGDNELKVVEITEKPESETGENTTAYPGDFMKRYEALLDENRVMRKLLDDLGCKDTDAGAGAGADAGADAGAGPVVMV